MSNSPVIKNLNIGNEILEYHIIYGKRKSIEIKLKSDGQIYVSAPFYIPIKDIEKFLKEKSNWIKNKLVLLKKQKESEKEELFERRTVPLKGDNILFNTKELNIKTTRVKLIGQSLELEIPKGFNDIDRNILLGETLKKFYKRSTADYLEKHVGLYEDLIGVSAINIDVRDQKSRWGSCSSKKNLNFNLRLAMMPEFVIDYIIVHELCHLKEMNHSKSFWGLVRGVYPDFEDAKAWLKQNTLRLMFI